MWLFHDLLCTPFHCLLKHETLAKLKCYFLELTFYTCGKYHLFSTLLFPRNCWDFFRLSALHKSPSLSHARSSLWRKMYPHNFVQLTIRNLLLSFFFSVSLWVIIMTFQKCCSFVCHQRRSTIITGCSKFQNVAQSVSREGHYFFQL